MDDIQTSAHVHVAWVDNVQGDRIREKEWKGGGKKLEKHLQIPDGAPPDIPMGLSSW